MSTSPDRLRYLLNAYANKTCTQEELQELNSLLEANWNNMDIDPQTPGVDWESIYERVAALSVAQQAKSRSIWYGIAVAASVVLIVGISSYFLFSRESNKSGGIVNTTSSPNDVEAPEKNKAMIVLSNGQNIYLNTVNNGPVVTESGAKVEKLADGQLVYTPLHATGEQHLVYNTLYNPKGSRVVDLTLADGTRVWLNAGSSLTYPVVFTGNERSVSITGEAYFEVASSFSPSGRKRTFTVSKNDMTVTVLGTHFNVNAYDDESDIRVTLLEGSVAVSKGDERNKVVIKPGQQVSVNKEVKAINNIDLETVMAWKNGYFNFNSADIKTIMRQLSRWYDVTVKYEGNVLPETITGELPRNVNASEVLKMLEYAGIHFRIEGKIIIVMP